MTKTFYGGVKLVALFIASLLLPAVSLAQNQLPEQKSKTNHTVAEWNKQDAVWATWPTDTAMQQVMCDAIKAISADVPVNLVITNDSIRNFAFLSLKNANVDFSQIKPILNSNAKGFIRDNGPWFLYDSNNQLCRTGFKWNNFGSPVSITRNITKKDSVNMGKFAGEVTNKMKLKIIPSDLVIENGMLEINGNGVAICFMETVLQRNPGVDLPTIVTEMKRVLGLKKIIWLGSAPTMDKIYAGPKSANIFAYGANGHIDQYVRFANDSTVLIAQLDPVERRFDPVSSGDYLILKENLEYLKRATDENDHPFNIIEVPVPAMRFHMKEDSVTDVKADTILFKGFENGTTIYNAPIVSYLNFFICNNTVIVPEYYNSNLTESERLKDENVGKLFEELFPGKKIVRINPLPLNFKGGGFHRAFLQQPAVINQ